VNRGYGAGPYSVGVSFFYGNYPFSLYERSG
jgi:hypothetical protein